MGCGETKLEPKEEPKRNSTTEISIKNSTEKPKRLSGRYSTERRFDTRLDSKVDLIFQDHNNIKDSYLFMEIITRDILGSVYKAKHKILGEIRKVRVIPLEVLVFHNVEKDFKEQISLVSKLDHINLVKIFDYYQDDQNYYIVMELLQGGCLFDKLTEEQFLNEFNAAKIIRQILAAVSHLHSNGIAHRDINPQNIYMVTNKQDFNIKLSSFYSAIFNLNPDALRTIRETPYYFSPEFLHKEYSIKSDIWSCGVILYILLCGYPPFKGEYLADIEVEIEDGKINMNSIEWDNISTLAKNFIFKLLEKDPEKRISADEALQDPWLLKQSKLDNTKLNTNAISSINTNDSLKKFNAKTKLQHASIAFIIHQLSCNEQTKDLRKIFAEMDKSGEGKLSIDELREGYNKLFSKKSLFSKDDFEKIIENFSQNNEDYIEYEDFLRATLSMDIILSENNLKMAFNLFDIEKTGLLTQDTLKKTLGLCVHKEEESKANEVVKNILAEVDSNGDGSISYDEFRMLMLKTLEKSK